MATKKKPLFKGVWGSKNPTASALILGCGLWNSGRPTPLVAVLGMVLIAPKTAHFFQGFYFILFLKIEYYFCVDF